MPARTVPQHPRQTLQARHHCVPASLALYIPPGQHGFLRCCVLFAVMSKPGVAAGADDTGESRKGAALPQPYERDDDADADDEEDEDVTPGGVGQVDSGRWAASLRVKDTGCMLDVGACAPPHPSGPGPCTYT